MSQQELRLLMKQKQQSSDNMQQLSGKDKAKLLKLMKEKEKEQNNLSNTKPKNDKKVSTQPVSTMPSDFFDSILPSDVPKQTQIQTTSASTSNIPQGFFDNPIDDLKVHGIDPMTYVKEQSNKEQETLHSFLQEINVIVEENPDLLVEKEDQTLQKIDETLEEEISEEELIKLAYLSKLARLYKQSDRVISQDKQPHLLDEQTLETESKQLDAFVRENIQQEMDSSILEAQDKALTTAQNIFRNKLQKKRNQEHQEISTKSLRIQESNHKKLRINSEASEKKGSIEEEDEVDDEDDGYVYSPLDMF